MAIFVIGMPCGICGKPIKKNEHAVGFPPIAASEKDPLFIFSDACFHRNCFEVHPLAAEASRRAEDITLQNKPGNRKCVVCGLEITDPDNYIGFGLVSSASADPLFSFNHLHFHRTHLAQWWELDSFKKLLFKDIQINARNENSAQKWLLKQLEQVAQ